MLHYTVQDPIFDTILDLCTLPHYSNHKSRKPSFTIPNTDILESKDEYKVVLQLPGAAKENIIINFGDNILTVSTNEQAPTSEKVDSEASEELGSQSEDSNDNKKEIKPKVEEFKTHIKQITTKPYKKVIEFPSQVDYESISADYANGLLTLILPKVAKTQRTIQVL